MQLAHIRVTSEGVMPAMHQCLVMAAVRNPVAPSVC